MLGRAVVFDVLRRHLRARGYKVSRPQHHRRRRQDHRPRATSRGCRRCDRGGALHRALQRRHDARSTCLPPDVEPRGDAAHRRDDRADRGARSTKGHAYAGRRRRLLRRRRSSPDYGKLSQPRPRRHAAGARVERRRPASATRSTSRCGRPPSPASRVGQPWGPGRPGWHIECSAMAVAVPRRAVRHPRRRRRPDVPAPRERDRAVGGRARRARSRATGCTTACVDDRRREDVEVAAATSSSCTSVLAELSRPRPCALFVLGAHYRSPIDYSPERLDESRRPCGNVPLVPARRAARRGSTTARRDAARRRSAPRWTTT